MLRRVHNAEPAGTVRIITPGGEDQALPIERFITIPHAKHQVCEISRIAIPEWLRCRQHALHQTRLSDDERQAAPSLSLLLALCCIYTVNRLERDHFYVLMEPRLARQLDRFGIHFTPIGEAIHLNGERYPYHVDRVSLNAGLTEFAATLYQALCFQLDGDRDLALTA